MSWDLESIEALFKDHDDFVVTREENCLLIANQDGIDAWLAISGEQILVESLLFAADEVKDKPALDHEILSSHMVFPLTTVGISTIGTEEYYTAFGALSAQSKAESIVIEVETLFQNVASFLDAYETRFCEFLEDPGKDHHTFLYECNGSKERGNLLFCEVLRSFLY